MPKKKSNVDQWTKAATPRKRRALEIASRHFDDRDKLTVNTLEAIYGQESSFGRFRRNRNIKGAAGDFHLEKETASRMGLVVSSKKDQRFDIEHSSAAAAKYLKTLDHSFSKETKLSGRLKTVPVSNSAERVKFVIAANNAGEGKIAKAQQLAKASGKDPQKWDDFKMHLEESGTIKKKAEEIREYVEKVLAYEKEFAKKSGSKSETKFNKPDKASRFPEGGHWITLDGKHIFIKDR